MKRLALLAILLTAWFCAPAHAQFNGCTSFCGTSSSAVVDGPGFNNIQASGGGGGVSCAQSTAYFARKSGTTNNTALATYICGLVTDGVWSKLDAVYIFAQDTQANSLLNLVQATFNGTATNAPAWVAGGGGVGGFTGNGTSSFVDSNFNPNTATTPNYTANSASLFVWSNSAAASTNPLAGTITTDSTHRSFIYTDQAGTAFFGANDSGTYSASAVVASGKGFYVANRNSGTTAQGYINGASVVSVTQTGGGLPLVDLGFGVGDSGLFSSQQFMAGGIGGSLSSTDVSNLYSRTHTLLQAIAGIP